MYNSNTRKRHHIINFVLILSLMLAVFVPSATYCVDGSGTFEDPYSVSQAISYQNGSSKTVVGYIVGQPVATYTVNTSGYTNDYAIALADSKGETDTSKMIYVQITTSFRGEFGLKSNPSMMGEKIKVTGSLTNYFSHAGVKSTVEFVKVTDSQGGTDPGTGSGDGSGNGTGSGTGSGTTNTTQYDNTYYANAMNKSGTALKSALHDIIDDHTEISYTAVWDALRYTDEDPNNSNNVILLYTGRSQSKYDNGGLVDQWNREHVWAKSHGNFGTTPGAGTDLHHLRPTDVSVNSSRGNLDFDMGGSPHSEAYLCNYDSDSWEPRDEVKGDIARMIFYMAVRYEGDVSGEVDLEINEQVANGSDPFIGKLSVLKAWNEQDPVDDFERHRNDVIFENYQFNRNPFIDHPEWVNSIWN